MSRTSLTVDGVKGHAGSCGESEALGFLSGTKVTASGDAGFLWKPSPVEFLELLEENPVYLDIDICLIEELSCGAMIKARSYLLNFFNPLSRFGDLSAKIGTSLHSLVIGNWWKSKKNKQR